MRAAGHEQMLFASTEDCSEGRELGLFHHRKVSPDVTQPGKPSLYFRVWLALFESETNLYFFVSWVQPYPKAKDLICPCGGGLSESP